MNRITVTNCFIILFILFIKCQLAPIVELIKERDYNSFKYELNQYPNVNKKITKSGLTLLHFAAQSGDIKIVKELVKRGANINAVTSFNATPLRYACYKSRSRYSAMFNEDIIHFLLKNGAQKTINVADNHGRTSIMFASRYHSPKVIHWLIKYGADLNPKTNGNPLVWASWRKDSLDKEEVIRILKEAGAKG